MMGEGEGEQSPLAGAQTTPPSRAPETQRLHQI